MLIFMLVCALLMLSRQLRDQKLVAKIKTQGIADMYRSDIRSTGAWLAERQNRVNHATYLSKGMERRDPEPIMGYPVCQLGCVVSCAKVDGIDICAESDFIAGYNDKLAAMKTNQSPNQAMHPRPVAGR